MVTAIICFVAAFIVLPHSSIVAAWETGTVIMRFDPGWEPHRAFGERGAGQPGRCKVGYYKSYAGAYPCAPCPKGTFAPKEGSTHCLSCTAFDKAADMAGSDSCTRELAAEVKPAGNGWGINFLKVPDLLSYATCLMSNKADCQHQEGTPVLDTPATAPIAAGRVAEPPVTTASVPDALLSEGEAAVVPLLTAPLPAVSPVNDGESLIRAPSPFFDAAAVAPAPVQEANAAPGGKIVAPLLPVLPVAGVAPAPAFADALAPAMAPPAASPSIIAPGTNSALPAMGPLGDTGEPLPPSKFTVAKVTNISPPVLTPREKEIQAAASISVNPAPCETEEAGSQRCGIPIGYEGNDRTGTVFFPPDYANRPLPYMLLLHGSGWTGSDMINEFKEFAIKHDHAIIAPDSHNPIFWSSPDTAEDDFTTDWYHIQACWDAVMKMPGVKANPGFLTAFGNSRASYAAVAFASRSTANFNSAAILHASALPQQMGARAFPILWTTGTEDPLYGPMASKPDVARFREERPDFPIKWEIWVDNHTIRNYTQIEAMVTWWLEPQTRGRFVQTY